MVRSPRDAHPSPRGDGNVTQVIVQIEQIAEGLAHTIDRSGLRRSVRMAAQRAKGANPTVGEWWIVDRTLSSEWSFATVLERKVPSVSSVPDLFGAMETAGFISSEYVPVENPPWPMAFRLNYMDYPKTQTEWPYNANSPNPSISYGGGYSSSGGGATPADLTFEVPMLAGTWSTLLHYTKGPDLGHITLVVDGVESAEIDCHQVTSYAPAWVVAHASLTIATSGVKIVAIRKKGTKNAASDEYFCYWTSVSGVLL